MLPRIIVAGLYSDHNMVPILTRTYLPWLFWSRDVNHTGKRVLLPVTCLRLDVVVLVDHGSPTRGHVCKLCIYTIKISHWFGQLGIPLIVIFPRAARDSAHNNGPLVEKCWRPFILRNVVFLTSLSAVMQLDITPPVKGHPMTCLRWHRWKVEL